jgi:toxin YhaV
MPFYAEHNGWKLFCYSAFQTSLASLLTEVQRLKEEQPDTFQHHPKTKLLKRILELIENEIPQNPGAKEYAQGNTLGTSYRHWRRAKFLGRFRLFFRYSSDEKIIIYSWVSDQNTLRKAGAKTDPYAVFLKKLIAGDPPDDWEALLEFSEDLDQDL